MAQNSKKPGNLTNLPPEVLQELIRIEEQDKQNNPEKKQNDQMMQALLAATGAVNGLMELKTGIDQNHQQTFSALQDTHARLSDAVEALNSNDQTGNFQQVVQGLDKLSREIQLKLVDVEKAAQSKPEIKPNIKVDAPKVNVTVDKPDLKPLQNLLKTELPKQVKALADAIPEVPETDLSTVEKSLKDMISVMQEVRDRKIPIPSFPTNMKVVNPDGTPISGGSGGGGTQYTSGGTAVPNPVGNSLIYFNGSNVPVAVTSANPLPITGTISVGSTADESAFTAGTSTTGPIAGVFNDSVATLTSGQQGTIRATTNRGLHTNLRNASGTEIATSSNPVRTDPTGTTTQPVSATSLPLPTGASTAAKQPALGTAGTPSADVLSVQGETGMTALKVDGSAVTQPVSATSLPLPTGASTSANQTNASQKTQIVDGSGNVIASTSNALNVAITSGGAGGTQYAEGITTSPATGTVALGRYQSSAPTLTTGQLYAPQLDANGNLKVSIASGGGSGGTSSSFAATFPTTGTAIGAKNGSNMVNLAADGSSNLLVNLATAIPAGSNAIGSITNTSFIATQATGTNLHTVVDSGSVTANAGTNLNTSALALETGGNLASIKTDTDNLNTAQGATTSGLKGPIIQGAVTTAAPTYTTATTNPLSLTTAGALRTDASGSTQPISGTITANAGTGTFNIQTNAAVNIAQIAGATALTGHGVASGALRVELPTDGTGVVGLNAGTQTVGSIASVTTSIVPGTAATNLGKARAATPGTTDTGTLSLSVRNDNAATAVNAANATYGVESVDTNGTQFVRQAPNNTSAITNVAGSATSVTLLSANAARRNFVIYNNSTSDCYVKYGTTASSTSFTYYLPSLGTLQDEFYAGRIDAIWIAANGSAQITEVSP